MALTESPRRGLAIAERPAYYTPKQLAERFNLSLYTIRTEFKKMPGVIIISTPKPGRRVKATMRIPQTAVEEWLRRRSVQCT